MTGLLTNLRADRGVYRLCELPFDIQHRKKGHDTNPI